MGLTNTAYLLLLLKGGAPVCFSLCHLFSSNLYLLLVEMDEGTWLGGFTAQPGPLVHLHKQIDKYHFEAVLQLVNSKLLFVSALMYVLRGFFDGRAFFCGMRCFSGWFERGGSGILGGIESGAGHRAGQVSAPADFFSR